MLRAALLSSAAALAAPSAAAGAAPRFVVAPERLAAAPYAQWAHSHGVWAEDSPNATQCAALVESYLARNISVGGLDVDSGWSTGYDNVVVTPAFGDLAGLTARMHALDVRVIMWATALVNTDSPNFAAGPAKGFFLRDALNETALVSWWHGRGAQAAQTSLGATLTVGLRGLLRRSVPCPPDDTQQDQFACNRDGADGGFATLRLEGQHVHPMPAGLPGRLTWRTSGQIALQPLVSGEQLTIGGTASVRGYLESEASGDTGLLATLEWQGPNLARWLSAGLGLGDGLLREAHGIGFIDAGLVRVIDPLPDQTARTGLAGAGMGLRMAGAAGSSADILLAWPLRRSAQTTDGRLRVHARVALSF
jgi:hypothetical protein